MSQLRCPIVCSCSHAAIRVVLYMEIMHSLFYRLWLIIRLILSSNVVAAFQKFGVENRHTARDDKLGTIFCKGNWKGSCRYI